MKKIDLRFRKANAHRMMSGEKGIVLVSAMLILIVLTILSVSMFRNFGLQERIAGNTREKQRAFNASQSALQYAEWWLAQGNGGTGSTCTSLLDANATPPTTQICSNAMTSPQTSAVPWKSASAADFGVAYLPPSLTVASPGQVNAYASAPRFYINPLGLDSSGLLQLYRVSAMGYGGNGTAVSVVESVYSIKSGVIDAGGL
jgi:type IV pilus assembly protein PilX